MGNGSGVGGGTGSSCLGIKFRWGMSASAGLFPIFESHDLADIFDFLLILAFEEFGVVLSAQGFGGVIAAFLEGLDFAGEAALEFDELGVFDRVGDEFAHEVGANKDSGKGGGGGLEADLWEFGGVMAAEEFGEVILEGAEFESMGLGGAPFLIAAASFPVGDITPGDAETAVVHGVDDFAVGDVVGEHAADHVAFEFGKVRDFAVARFGGWTVLGAEKRGELWGQAWGLG